MPIVAKHLKKPSPHAKKRVAAHHRKSKQYLKTYWPYIPLLLIVGLGVIGTSQWSARSKVLGTTSNFSDSALLASTNAQRLASHQSPLSLDPKLDAAASAKAQDMIVNNYWAHISPRGKTPWDFISASGYQYSLAGENLAYGFSGAAETIAGWMSSPEHRANILNQNYQAVGFGVADAINFVGKGPNVIVVALYARPANAASTISFQVSGPVKHLPALSQQQPSSQLVSRLTMVSGDQQNLLLILVSVAMGAALSILIVRNAIRIRKLLSRGELFLARHLILDIILVVIILSCFIATRVSGTIR